MDLLERNEKARIRYRENKKRLRQYAIDWQSIADTSHMSYGEIADAQYLFETMGKRLGLLREFHANGIC